MINQNYIYPHNDFDLQRGQHVKKLSEFRYLNLNVCSKHVSYYWFILQMPTV